MAGIQARAGALGTAFTYQGQLQHSGSPANDTCDFQFSLFDAASGGNQVGTPQALSPVSVAAGLFTVQLDFGGSAFNGADRFLQIAVRCPVGNGTYTTLTPRQPLTAAPYALYSPVAGFANDLTCTGCLSTTDLANGAVTTAKIGDGQVSTAKLSAGGSTNGQVLTSSGTGVTWQTPSGASSWSLTGNAGTTGTHFLGTSDNQALELRVNGTRAFRLEPKAVSPNVIGGFSGNAPINGNVVGATIGGGGNDGATNGVANFATVAGGRGNFAIADDATVSGGSGNIANAVRTTVGGGGGNIASFDSSTVGGGFQNMAEGAHAATVGGGQSNTASGEHATVAGGFFNTASGDNAVVAGGFGNEARGISATIAGGGGESATGNHVTDNFGTVGGGSANLAGNDNADLGDARWATVGGGHQNRARGVWATVGGGQNNLADGTDATIAGGADCHAGGDEATVAGGGGNEANGYAATIGGGSSHSASGRYSTVAGGAGNVANGEYSTAAGGRNNHAEGAGSFAAGDSAHAVHNGSFVWSDGTRAGGSIHDNDFNVTATGGIEFYHSPDDMLHCDLTPSKVGWNCFSDRNGKENFVPVDGRDILRRVSAMPVLQWNVKGADPSEKQIGPVAQDFHAAFGLGSRDTTINSSDAQGVAFAAIQGLYASLQERDGEIAELKARLAEVERKVAAPAAVASSGATR